MAEFMPEIDCLSNQIIRKATYLPSYKFERTRHFSLSRVLERNKENKMVVFLAQLRNWLRKVQCLRSISDE